MQTKMQMASKNGTPNNQRQVEHIERKTSLVHQRKSILLETKS